MKITKTSLKRIIKEELTRVLKEYEGEGISGPSHVGSAEEVAKGHAETEAAIKFALWFQQNKDKVLDSLENEYDPQKIAATVGPAIAKLTKALETLEEDERYRAVRSGHEDLPEDGRRLYDAYVSIRNWIEQLQQWLN